MAAIHALCKKRERRRALDSAALVGPGSYLLSRSLLPDYHRRANVSLPGSGWDRVGPLGCDHQASTGFSLCCRLPARGCCLGGAVCMDAGVCGGELGLAACKLTYARVKVKGVFYFFLTISEDRGVCTYLIKS